MSSLFPERSGRAGSHGVLLGTLTLAGLVLAVPVHAQQAYWQPLLETGVEQNTNRNLATIPEDEADVWGYFVEAAVLWGYVTPTSDTQFRPQVRFQRYPDRDEIQNSEQYIDFSTRHQATERSAFDLVARYSREDAFRSELVGAEFDDFDPDDPLDDADGSTTVTGTDTRQRLQVRPRFSHELSDVTGFRVDSTLRAVRFDSDLVDRSEYDYIDLRGLMTRRYTPRTRFLFGPTVSRYETRDNRNQTDEYGFDASMDHMWSEMTRIRAGASVVRSEIEFNDGSTITSESDTNFGLTFDVRRRTEVGYLQFRSRRSVRPTSRGSVVVEDDLRLQYDHDFSERLSLTSALRFNQQEAPGTVGSDRNRDGAWGELWLNWMATPTLFVRSGYRYAWREFEAEGTSADNHAVWLSFGYRGLGRPE